MAQVSRKFPGRSAAWENARSLATDGKAEQCRLPMFLSGLVKTKHLEELQTQSGRVPQTPNDDFTVFTIRTSEVCIQSHLRCFFNAILVLSWNQDTVITSLEYVMCYTQIKTGAQKNNLLMPWNERRRHTSAPLKRIVQNTLDGETTWAEDLPAMCFPSSRHLPWIPNVI